VLVFGIEFDATHSCLRALESAPASNGAVLPAASDAVLCLGGDGGAVGGRAVTLMFWAMQCGLLAGGRTLLIPYMVLFSGEASISL